MKLSEFTINFKDDQLAMVRNKLVQTTWAEDIANDDWGYGVNKQYLQSLVQYWIDDFDWRIAERKINQYMQYKITIGDVPVHFMYIKGNGINSIPLILTHGCPWTFWDFHRVIKPLTEPEDKRMPTFDLIIPSLPGHGFSVPARGGMNFWKTADIWHTLMTEVLGYAKYGASGGDWGALVTSQLGHKYANSLHGIHLMHTMRLDQFNSDRPWDVIAGHKTAENTPPEIMRESLERMRKFVSHYAVHMIDPQTLSFALQDSPVGLLAWLLERWNSWSQNENNQVERVFSKEHMITNTMLYWMTKTVSSSLRYYYDAARYPWRPSHRRNPMIEAPTSITFLGGENPVGINTEHRVETFLASEKAKDYHIKDVKAHQNGGHFGYYENPQAAVEDIRNAFSQE